MIIGVFVVQTSTTTIAIPWCIGHACTIVRTFHVYLDLWMNLLVAVCVFYTTMYIVHLLADSLCYYSWENCTTYISFSCIVTLASKNQNIYWKIANEVPLDTSRSSTASTASTATNKKYERYFPFTLRSQDKSIQNWKYSDVKLFACAQNAQKRWFSESVLQSNNNLILCTIPGRLSQIIELLECRDVYKDYSNKIKCNKNSMIP